MNERGPNLDDRAAAIAAELGVLVGKLKRRLREAAPPGDLSWPQAAVIGRLARDGSTTVSDLARAENMRPQSMGVIVAALEEMALVRGAPDPADGRRTILSLTAKSEEWIKAHRKTRENWLSRLIGEKLSPDEQDALARGVELLKRIIES